MSRFDRTEFGERLRLQVQARYPHTVVSADTARFGLRVTAPGIDATVSLAPLHNACERQPARTAELIGEFVHRIERQLTVRRGDELSPGRLLWCVRSHTYLDGVGRRADLIVQDVGADLVAFVAETLPNSSMRGVPRDELETAGLDESAARDAASAGTAVRFAGVAPRIAAADRVPADGWKLGGDVLYQGSVLLLPDVLAAFAARAGGEVLLANPDRAVVLALPATLPAARTFGMRVTREWREAMNPVSRSVLVTDGSHLRPVERRGSALLPWLAE